VIAAAKLMGLNPSSPPFTLLLVMLHTGTMFAVIAYFWRAWKRAFFSSRERFIDFAKVIIIATVMTGVVFVMIKIGIEQYLKHQHGIEKAEIEELFKHLDVLAAALAAAGLLILYSGLRTKRDEAGRDDITSFDAVVVGAAQGLSLPFRGFSRSGSTISVGLLRGMSRVRLEEFSFALAVVLTPMAVLWESRRLVHSRGPAGASIGIHDFLPGLIGMIFSFVAGLIALKLLSRLLEHGKWWIFGIYCLAAAGGLYVMYLRGY
jgi:undecaprenyl-diphosphatase